LAGIIDVPYWTDITIKLNPDTAVTTTCPPSTTGVLPLRGACLTTEYPNVQLDRATSYRTSDGAWESLTVDNPGIGQDPTSLTWYRLTWGHGTVDNAIITMKKAWDA